MEGTDRLFEAVHSIVDYMRAPSMDNSTFPPENDTSLNSPSFMAYSILLAMAIVVGSLLIVFTILALLMATAVPRPVRLFLINLLLAGLLVAVSSMFMVCTATILIAVSTHSPLPRYLCRVYLGSGPFLPSNGVNTVLAHLVLNHYCMHWSWVQFNGFLLVYFSFVPDEDLRGRNVVHFCNYSICLLRDCSLSLLII